MQWRETEATLKLDDITAQLTQGIHAICSCPFTTDKISQARFLCFANSPNQVTYRAKFIAMSQTEGNMVIQWIEEWVTSTPSVPIQGMQLSIDGACSVKLKTFNDGECQVKNDINLSVALGAALGSIVAVTLLLATFIVGVIIKCKKVKK